MNFKQLEAFVRIAENRSFSKTAQEMFLTQPTVSAYVHSLEKDLGTRLFYRTTKEVTLTESGEKIYLYARNIVDLSDRIRNVLSEMHDKGSGQIIISTSSIPGQYLLPGILAEFCRQFPGIQFRINETDSRGVADDIMNHKADIGFAGTAVAKSTCDFFPFYWDELVLITPNGEEYRNKEPGSVDWIQSEPFILREDGSGTRREALKALRANGIDTDKLNVVASFANTGAILLSVKEGIGIAVVSRLAADTVIKTRDILAFPLAEEGCYRGIHVVTSKLYPLSENADKLFRMVKGMHEMDNHK